MCSHSESALGAGALGAQCDLTRRVRVSALNRRARASEVRLRGGCAPWWTIRVTHPSHNFKLAVRAFRPSHGSESRQVYPFVDEIVVVQPAPAPGAPPRPDAAAAFAAWADKLTVRQMKYSMQTVPYLGRQAHGASNEIFNANCSVPGPTSSRCVK